MFLATTGLTEFWDKNQEILFLGSWCLPPKRRHSSPSGADHVLPSPWQDPNRFRQAAQYLDSCQERMLHPLADYLNTLHRVSLPTRSWRILIGPWLMHSLHVTYDRTVLLRNTFERHPALHTWVLDPTDFQTPQDTSETIDWTLEDPYNLQLFSQLLQTMGYAFPIKPMPNNRKGRTPGPPDSGVRLSQKGPSWLKTISRHFLKQGQGAFRKVMGNRCKVALLDPYLAQTKRWRFAWATDFKVLPFELGLDHPIHHFSPCFDEKRNHLKQLPATDSFEMNWVQMLPQNFPTVYLEGFRSMREWTGREISRIPSVILSGNGWYTHEPFKFLAAEAHARGKRLVGFQHGGGYGLYEAAPQEHHERKICDTFYVWGWARKGDLNLRNLPAPQLSEILDLGLPNRSRKQNILLVTSTNPRYFYRFTSAPQALQLEDYFEWEARFLRALRSSTRSRILFRPHRHPYGHQLRERFTTPFPEIRWSSRGPLKTHLKNSRLVVLDHLGTPTLEALVANIPTVMFWNPQHWPVREQVQEDLETLRRAGLLFHTPEGAAQKVEQLFSNPWVWWQTSTVQRARLTFIQKYALASSGWPKAWRDAMEKEVLAATHQQPDAVNTTERFDEVLTA